MHTAARSVENTIPSEAEALATTRAAVAIAARLVALLEELAVPGHVAMLGACWLVADLLLAAEVHGTPAGLARGIVDRQIGEALGELRTAYLADPSKLQ